MAVVLLFVLVVGIASTLVGTGERSGTSDAATGRTSTTSTVVDETVPPPPDVDRDTDDAERTDRTEGVDDRERRRDAPDDAPRAVVPQVGAETGDAQRVGRRRVVVDGVERRGDQLVVAVRIRNVGRQALPYEPADFTIELADDAVVAGSSLPEPGWLRSGEVAPEQEVEGLVQFAVPEGDHIVIFDPGSPRQGRWRVSG